MQPIENLWDDAHAASLDDPQLLLYRSNLLGRDLRITNFGGGNTSAKLPGTDPLSGAEETVLWVKGSGGDLGSMKLDGFAALYPGVPDLPAPGLGDVFGVQAERRRWLETHQPMQRDPAQVLLARR